MSKINAIEDFFLKIPILIAQLENTYVNLLLLIYKHLRELQQSFIINAISLHFCYKLLLQRFIFIAYI